MDHRGRAAVGALIIGLGVGLATTPVGAGTDPTEPPSSSAPTATTGGTWEQLVPGGDCRCADGSEWSFFARDGDPERVLFVLEGGGACWSPETCAPGGPYDPDVGADEDPAGIGGVVDLTNPDNPFADWSMIYVPYCTGDVHIGAATRDDGDRTIEHLGAVNGATALAELSERFPAATQIVVAGASAGSIATPLYAGMVQDRFPDAAVLALGDGSGGYPTDAGSFNAQLLDRWGFAPRVAAWPEAAAIPEAEWNFTRFWSVTGEHAPDVEMVRFDYAQDAVQLTFIGLAGLAPVDLPASQEANEAAIEATGTDVESFVAFGAEHTVILGPAFYEVAVGDVRFVDWLTDALTDDAPVPDVRPG